MKKIKAHTYFTGTIKIPDKEIAWDDSIFKNGQVVIPIVEDITIKAVQRDGKIIGWTKVPEMAR